MSDSAVIPYPSLDDKRKIITVCTDALRRLGIARPSSAPCAPWKSSSPNGRNGGGTPTRRR